ncbi:uncharacterized protein B0I36DRAFT_321371 [Microdochium trichocladiopsis]|uniref:Secreted protein n=1 Tax=Microdochium trichocladiopsis TaxID=1682393 RepID=A0A9P8Y9T7_9PEZI|nr:uncharacterized protein B0I36DRAFT_321371 [Microdochium trichocladiopsis]KAH7033410.1 hypothetical protein B0I36DRAFT_321371 [Microdochium trichocladiopsis]
MSLLAQSAFLSSFVLGAARCYWEATTSGVRRPREEVGGQRTLSQQPESAVRTHARICIRSLSMPALTATATVLAPATRSLLVLLRRQPVPLTLEPS